MKSWGSVCFVSVHHRRNTAVTSLVEVEVEVEVEVQVEDELQVTSQD